jgi:hypothetical protein
VATTRLSPAGWSGRPYGSLAKTPVPEAHAGTFTRLSPAGFPGRLYGSFTKSAATEDTKTSSFSIRPRVTIGDVTDVDLETTTTAIPRVALTRSALRTATVTMSLVPSVTQARGSILSSSTDKQSSHSLIPRVTMSVVRDKQITVTQSLIPVVTLSSTVDDTFEEYLTTQSLIPVVTLTNAVLATSLPKSSSHSLIPVVTMTHQVNRVDSATSLDAVQTLAPRVTLTCSAGRAGDVDQIEIITRPFGEIEITPA